MAEIHWVTKAQVAAARLAVDMTIEDGEEPDPVLVKIANATPMRRSKPQERVGGTGDTGEATGTS
jgi:ribosomal protein L16/L10AE